MRTATNSGTPRWKVFLFAAACSAFAFFSGYTTGGSDGYLSGYESGAKDFRLSLTEDTPAASELLSPICYQWWFGENKKNHQHSIEQICRQKKR